jgi:hypothetical protein
MAPPNEVPVSCGPGGLQTRRTFPTAVTALAREFHALGKLRRARRRNHHVRMPATATPSTAMFAVINGSPSVQRTERRPPRPRSHSRPTRIAWGQPCAPGSYRMRAASTRAVSGKRTASRCMTLAKLKDVPNRASRSRAVAVVTTRIQRQRDGMRSAIKNRAPQATAVRALHARRGDA